MSTKFNEIKPIKKLEKVISTLDSLYDEFEKKNPEKIKVNCPFCSSEKSTIAFTYKNCKYCRCLKCDSIYLSPRITEEWLREYYSFMQAKFVFDIPESQRQVRIDNLMKPRWKLLCEKFKPFIKSLPVSRYMEVGPGVGYFTEVAQSNNCAEEYILVEPDIHCQARLRELGTNIKIFSSILENIEVKECGKVDIIFINSVIEHPFSINTFFSKLNELLNDSGIVVLVDMHCNGLDIQTLKQNAPNVNVYSILQIGSINGIKILSEKNGFDMKDVFSIGEMDVDIVYEYLKGMESNHPLKNLEKILSKNEFRKDLQALLSKHLLTGYNGYIFQKK